MHPTDFAGNLQPMQAMMKMKNLDIVELERAARA
jgi:hypothetical protein